MGWGGGACVLGDRMHVAWQGPAACAACTSCSTHLVVLAHAELGVLDADLQAAVPAAAARKGTRGAASERTGGGRPIGRQHTQVQQNITHSLQRTARAELT